VASCRPVSTLAAVSRVSVLRPRVAQSVAVYVAKVPLLAGLDALRSARLSRGQLSSPGRDVAVAAGAPRRPDAYSRRRR
jgi:hypothetical protein